MSRAQLLDERPEEEAIDTTHELEQDGIEDPIEEEPQEPELPEKYQGKSVEDLVQMHQELEKFSGKQSTEVGELRSVVDSYIQTQLAQQQYAPQQQQYTGDEEDVDFFVDPKTAVQRAIDNHPKIRQAEAAAIENHKQAALGQLQSRHPDMEQILRDPKFAEWIKGSKVRTQLFVQADQMYDYDSANELFDLWKERNNVAKQTASVEKQARKNTLRSANTGNARGTTEGTRRKVYRRADIIKLMKTDPERYQSMSDEILQAYAEGRVK